MKNPMLIVLLLCAVGSLVLAGFQFAAREWAPAVYVTVIGVLAIAMIAALMRASSQMDIPLDAADSGRGRIVMRAGSATVGSTLYWAIGFYLTAVGLAECPNGLWTPWLSYPAAFVALVLTAVMLLVATAQQLERVVADSSGVVVLTETRGIAAGGVLDAGARALAAPETRVAWQQVGAARRVETSMRRSSRQGGGSATLKHEFVLLGRQGEELLSIEEPLDPPDRYRCFLESIPHWTGLEVEDVRVTR